MKTKTTPPPLKNSISRLLWQRGFLFIALASLAFVCIALSPTAQAAPPPGKGPPDGDLGNGNTAEGFQALFSLTTGVNNTANGSSALFSDTTGEQNTATGSSALYSNTTGSFNTANGAFSLSSNTTGEQNTATGRLALYNNTTGRFNTATGNEALFSNTSGGQNTATGLHSLGQNTTGFANTATGFFALYNNTTGNLNTANGDGALYSNTTGGRNTANGVNALLSNTTGTDNAANGINALANNTTGSSNTADGNGALFGNTTGNNNIALGVNAGSNLTTGDNNIEIGNSGFPAEVDTIRIGGVQTATFMAGIFGTAVAGGTTVYITPTGQLGTVPSSRRFKDEIKSMDKASEAILSLKPVTFRYKQQLDPKGIPQFGLIAEDVEKANPDLVLRDADGKIYSVRYEAVNAMLLNEFLKEHRKVTELEGTAVQQQKEINALTAQLKEQAAQIQKVSARVEANVPAPQVVDNDR